MKNENTISVLFEDKTLYSNILKNFRDKARENGLSVEEHVLYNLLRGLPADRGFTPISNTNKLQNNCMRDPMYALKSAKYQLRMSFGYIAEIDKISKELDKQVFKDEEARSLYLHSGRFSANTVHWYLRTTALVPDVEVRTMVFTVLKEMLK